MKISRKMKKFFVSFLTAALSIIMLVTQVSAWNVVTYDANFEEESEIVQANEYMTWNITRNMLSIGVDLDCYDHEDVENVHATLNVFVSYYVFSTDTLYTDFVHEFKYATLTPEESWDSDELLVIVQNFERGYEKVEIMAEITYDINYYNGNTERYVYQHNAYLYDGETFTWHRDHTAHVLIFPTDNEN